MPDPLVAVGVSARSSLEKVRWGLPLPGSLQSISFGDYTFDCAKDCSNEICEVLGTKTSSGTLHAISMLGCAARITKMYGTSLLELSPRASVRVFFADFSKILKLRAVCLPELMRSRV
jgi:hypothetical protein